MNANQRIPAPRQKIVTGEDYIQSLHGRNLRVFLLGELIAQPVDHPLIRPSINAMAKTYDLALARPDLATALSPFTGERVNRFLHIAMSAEDVVRQNKMQRRLGQLTGTCFQRCVGMDALNALYSVTYEIDEKYGTPYHGRLKAFIKEMQLRNYVIGGAMTDVKGDRSKPPSQQTDPDLHMHVRRRSPEGIYIRGAKAHQTGCINSHWLIVMPTLRLEPGDRDFAIVGALPVDAAGITYVYGRQACDTRSLEGGEIDVGNRQYSGQEALVIFEDAFIPNEFVFMDGETDFAALLVERFTSYHRRSYVCKSGVGDVLIGAAATVADYNGVGQTSHIRDKLVEMTHLNETIYATGIASSYQSHATKSGAYLCDDMLANVCKHHVTKIPYEMGRLAQDLAGGLVVTLPSEADYRHEELGPLLEKYLKGRDDVPTEQRLRILRLIENMTLGRNAVGYLTESLHGAGSPQAQRIQIYRQMQLSFKQQLAKRLAGIDMTDSIANDLEALREGYFAHVFGMEENENKRASISENVGADHFKPPVKACDAIFDTPAIVPTPASIVPPKVTPSQTATSIPSIKTPAQTPSPAIGEFFSLNPFIEAHPEAVFIKRTNVPVKTDEQAKWGVGFEFAQEIFIYGTTVGIPLSQVIAIKANVTHTEGMGRTEAGMGIITDVHFTEGLIEGMKGLGFPADHLYLREGNWLKDGACATDLLYTGYVEMAERTGINSLYFPSGRRITDLTLKSLKGGTEVVWKNVPNGIVFKRIGYISPYNRADAWILNIAKFKAHILGMSLCVKNLQGMCVCPHVHFCENVQKTMEYSGSVLKDFQPKLANRIAKLHTKHCRVGIPRWDRPGKGMNTGYGMESWAQRTCDSISVTNVGLNVIEGIYSRNGNGFMKGPGPNGEAEDFMTNILIFGKDPFRVDIIGTWLAGHEPGNFGLFHIAKERGLLKVLNPWEIPVYLWDKSNPQPTSLSNFKRVSLVTPYLQRNYRHQNEPLYHLVNEPFNYP